MSPDQYCRDKLVARACSDHYALLFLPQPQRRVATALCALRRELQEAAQQPSDPALAQATLGWWAQEIGRAFDGHAQHPVTRALAPQVRAWKLSPQPFEALLQGHARELQADAFEDFDELKRHCEQSGVPFCETLAGLFSPLEDPVRRYCANLALALHLIRALRDCGRRARRGHLTLPLRDLRNFGVAPADLADARYGAGFTALAALQAGRAREALAAAAGALPAAHRRAQAPGIILAALYRTLLDEMERSGFEVLHQRIALTPIRKLRVAWRTWIFGPPGSMRRMPAPLTPGAQA